MSDEEPKLYLHFHGRIIDSLGIQMYQSPVAAIAELIANAWDADATEVVVELPESLSGDPKIVVRDNGGGMTFQQCQDRYLNVGRNRRVEDATDSSPDGRPVLGRKGIGKFAGFGIAEMLEVDTISGETGERTVFRLDLNRLRGEDYVGTAPKEVPLVLREAPDDARRSQKGTSVTLTRLKLGRAPSKSGFASSMARRFLINQSADNFDVKINGLELPQDNALMGVEFDFPTDYRDDEKPAGLRIENSVGIEKVGDDEIQWRVKFTQDTIGTEELRGVSVFCGIKVAQTPFFFNLSGGLSGQHGQQYMSGQVQADFLDKLDADIITTERQRINWEHEEAQPLQEWGQQRVKSLLSIWKARRAEDKLKRIDNKVAPFSQRLERLKSTERRTVAGAIKKIAMIESISEAQFTDLSNGILTAWEGGRLHELIDNVASVETMDESVLLNMLAEAQVLNALHVAEAVKAKVEIVSGLRKRIEERDLENAVRDYIAENPWLMSPEWETFKKETSVRKLVSEAAIAAGLDDDERWNKRVDLVMSSGRQLLIVEFLRPGLTVDRDHINRYQEYIDVLRSSVEKNTDLEFKSVSGLLVADKLDRRRGMDETLKRLAKDDMRALEWHGLLERAEAQWEEFLTVLVERAPEDERLSSLRGRIGRSDADAVALVEEDET
ncbi:MAG: ATP-binding protein [Wenzhouxiangella sp.]